MSFQITGKLIKRYDTEQKTEAFKAREFVIETTDGQYPQFIKFQCVQDRTGIIDGYAKDEQITVHFDLRGREYNEKYFTNLNAWRVEKAQGTAPAPANTPATSTPAATETVSADESLPF